MIETKIEIDGHPIGANYPPYVIAELSANHNGDIDRAISILKAAKSAGADAVKLQTYTADTLTIDHDGPDFQLKEGLWAGNNLYHLYESAHTPWEWHESLFDKGRELGITIFSTPFDRTAVDFLEQFDPPCYKIPSACLTDDNLLRYIRQTGRPLILSTGMSTVEQIDHAVQVLGTQDLIILNCTSTYPANSNELNLRVIPRFLDRYKVPIGYSGHEGLVYTTLAAVALGACLVERHITLNRAMWGSDHAASLEPQGVTKLINYIRATEVSLGDGEKRLYPSEVPVMNKLRKDRH